VEQLEDEGREVDREVCDILVHLQFQDRISQILDHVQQDIARLRECRRTGQARCLPPAMAGRSRKDLPRRNNARCTPASRAIPHRRRKWIFLRKRDGKAY
jgi:hypothetical protein